MLNKRSQRTVPSVKWRAAGKGPGWHRPRGAERLEEHLLGSGAGLLAKLPAPRSPGSVLFRPGASPRSQWESLCWVSKDMKTHFPSQKKEELLKARTKKTRWKVAVLHRRAQRCVTGLDISIAAGPLGEMGWWAQERSTHSPALLNTNRLWKPFKIPPVLQEQWFVSLILMSISP